MTEKEKKLVDALNRLLDQCRDLDDMYGSFGPWQSNELREAVTHADRVIAETEKSGDLDNETNHY